MRQLQERGHRVCAIDTKLGGSAHDVLRSDVRQALLFRLAAGEFDAVFIAPPCSSFSIRRRTKLRSVARPWGVHPIPKGWAAYLDKANGLVRVAIEVMRVARAVGVPVALENPSARSDDRSPAFWEDFSDWGSIWDLPEMQEELRASGATMFTFAQCADLIGGPAQKWTTIAATGALATELAILRECACPHGTLLHPERCCVVTTPGDDPVLALRQPTLAASITS